MIFACYTFYSSYLIVLIICFLYFSDSFIHKTRQRYNKPQSLTTRVNLAELSEEMKLRPPHLLNVSDIEPIRNGYHSFNIPQVAG